MKTGTYEIKSDLTTAEVLEKLYSCGKPLSEWGKAVDGTPILSVRTGGDRTPAILITAGAHSDETAGIHACLALLELLDTEHEVHILPLRDPYGFSGADHCLSVAAGAPVHAANHAEALAYLQTHAVQLWKGGQMAVFKLGEIGFVWNPLGRGLDNFWAMFNEMGRLSREEPECLAPLRGKSMMLLNADTDTEGAREMSRCWHSILSSDGQWLHLNRFFGRADAPPETAALDRLILTIKPGLSMDLHEGNGSGFWLPIPKPEKNVELSISMGTAYFNYIHSQGYPVTTYEEWLATDRTGAADLSWMIPEPRVPGLFWTKSSAKGEGPNFVEYTDRFGIAFGSEAPMEQPLWMRVDGITQGMLAAIRVWEQANR